MRCRGTDRRDIQAWEDVVTRPVGRHRRLLSRTSAFRLIAVVAALAGMVCVLSAPVAVAIPVNNVRWAMLHVPVYVTPEAVTAIPSLEQVVPRAVKDWADVKAHIKPKMSTDPGASIRIFALPNTCVSGQVGCSVYTPLQNPTTEQYLDQCRIWLNTDFAFGTEPSSGVVDTYSALAHELGHCLGLTHSSNDENEQNLILRNALMYYRIDPNNRAITNYDKLALYTRYSILGDYENDGVVNGIDWGKMARNWTTGEPQCGIEGDMNDDCIVNSFDRAILVANWGKRRPVEAVRTAGTQSPGESRTARAVVAQSAQATLAVSPSGGTYAPGATFTVAVLLNTNGVTTVGTDSVLLFDPAKLEAQSISTGSIYGDYPLKTVAPGRVEISGATLDPTGVSGAGTLAQVTFKVRSTAPGGPATVRFDFDPVNKQRTSDTNVVDRATSADILGAVTDGSYTVQRTGPLALIVDTLADEADLSPGDGVCVTTSNRCSLRAAIEEANGFPGADTIALGPGVYPLTTGILTITDSVEITGADRATTIIDGAGVTSQGGLIELRAPTVKLARMTVRNAKNLSTNFGTPAISQSTGSVTIEQVIIRDNVAAIGCSSGTLMIDDSIISNNSGSYGGTIMNFGGNVTIRRSVISDNVQTIAAGIMNTPLPPHDQTTPGYGELTLIESLVSNNRSTEGAAGGILNYGTLLVKSSTISGNSAPTYGGGIQSVGGTTTIVNSTVVGNQAPVGGGLSGNSSNVTVRNTLLANNLPGGNCAGPSVTTSLGTSLDSDGSCGFSPNQGNLINVNPKLGPLQDNGGPTWTYGLLDGSPAIDKADNATCGSIDQRGLPRPKVGISGGQASCDIGAFELQTPYPPPPGPCSPRPRIALQVSHAAGRRLQVTVSAGSGVLSQIQFGTGNRPLRNASVDFPGQATAITDGRTIPMGTGVTQTTFFVSRIAPGQVTVPMVVTDACGPWETFVGGGSGAF